MSVLGTTRAFRAILLGAWATYLSLVCLTNTADALRALDVLGDGFAFASGNWELVRETTGVYDTPTAIDAILFGGVIGWEASAAVLFWLALAGRVPVMLAATVALGLWAAFIVADEVFLAYPIEGTHWRLLIALVVSVLALRLLPDERPA
ncbi:MAG TPA: hypothetical protein VNZ62_02225 [Capillimicrobium sp.]|nr:hypothetical protein [Capillimicrobium sp.]